VAFTTKESVTALVGVPVSLKDFVLRDALAVRPVGSLPDAIAHL